MEGEEAPAVNLGGRMRTTESYCARGARLLQPPMPIGEVKWMHARRRQRAERFGWPS
jgi:hypothetical protein